MSDSLPKYMLLDQNSQEIRDRRIMPQTIYTEQGDRAIVTKKKKIANTINFPKKVNKSSSIYNLQYSSKYGLLFIATNNEVIIKTTQQLQQDLIAEQHLDNFNLIIKFSGELFLSPDEEIIAVCSQSLIQFVKLSSLAKSNNIEVPPLSNVNDSNHFLWVDNSNFVGWKFQGNSMLYTIDPTTLTLKLQQRELPMQFITGASVIHEHLFLISKMAIKIFQPFTVEQPVVKAEIDMTDPNHQSPYFQYSYIIDIFKVNISQKQFTPNDIYALAVVFYDVDEDATDERYLTFAKGDIFNRGSLQIRGYQNLYSTKTSRDLFYNDFEQKTSFSIKRVISSGFICLALQKSQKVYVVDPLEDFQRLNIYDIKSKHQLKNQQGKFLQGMTIMKNMLQCQKTVPEKAQQLLLAIINKYNGQFMSLYFKDKETNLTVTFPSSILAIGGEKFYRRYAISSINGIQDQNNQEILKKISQINRSPHILPSSECKKMGEKSEKQSKEQQKSKKDEQKNQVKQQKNQVKQQIKEIKKEEIKEVKDEKKEEIKKQEKTQQNKPIQEKKDTKKQEVKEQQKKVQVKVEENKKIQQKINPFAVTAKDITKPPMTAASLFANNALKSEGTKPLFPPSALKEQTKATPQQNIKKIEVTIQKGSTQNIQFFTKAKEQPSNPFFNTKINKEPSFLFGVSDSKPLLSNVPNLFSKTQPDTPLNNFLNKGFDIKKTQLFSGGESKPLFNLTPDAKPFQTKQADNKLNSLFIAPKNNIFNKLPEEKKQTISNNTTVVNKKQQEKPSIFALVKNQQKFKLDGLYGLPPVDKKIDLPKEPQPSGSVKAQQPKIQKQIKRENQVINATITKQVKNQSKQSQAQKIKKQSKQKQKNQAQKIKKQSLLQAIRKKASVYATWQKDTFSNLSKDTQPTSFRKIKQFYNKQFKLLSNIKTQFFKQTEQPMTQFYTQSIKKSPTYQRIQIDPNYQHNEEKLKQNLNYYEQVSNKMLYYINQLGKKKQNMRASNLSNKHNPQKAANYLTRITQNNQEKINSLDQQSRNKLQQLRYINNQKILEKRKKKQKIKGKRYNFQDQDDAEEESKLFYSSSSKLLNVTNSSTQININKQIKTVVISLDNINQTPKIKLPQFQPKSAPSQSFSKKADPQTSKNTSKSFSNQQPSSFSSNPAPSSFVEKIPPKKQKVQVPLIPKAEVKKEQQKQAISQIYQQSQNAQQEQLQIPSTKRQISSIQPANEIKGLKASTQYKQKVENEVKSSQPQAKKGAFGAFQSKKVVKQTKEGQDSMLFSQTSSMFSTNKNTNTFFNSNNPLVSVSSNPADKSKTEEEKKPAETKPLNSIFNSNPVKTQQPKGNSIFGQKGGIFGQKTTQEVNSVPSSGLLLKPNQPKTSQTKLQDKKVTQAQNKQQNKATTQQKNNIFPSANNKANSMQDAFKNMSFGQQKKAQEKKEPTQKQENNAATNPIFSQKQPVPSASPAEQKKQQVPTDSEIQANKLANLPSSNSATSLNTNSNTNPIFQNNNNNSNSGNAFMGGSFGTQPAPQFGSGNNKFMNNGLQSPSTNATGFNPNAVKFAGIPSNSAPKTFSSFGGQNKIFQQPSTQNNQAPFANETNVFNNASNSALNSIDSSNNNQLNNQNQGFNSNSGGNIFKQNQNNNSNSNQLNNVPNVTNNAFSNNSSSNNVFANQANNTNPFNKGNSFANNNVFANNNSFANNNNNSNNAFNNTANNNSFANNNNLGNNSFTNNNNNNSSSNMFNNTNSNNNVFAQNNNANNPNNNNAFGNNNNTNNNFLANLKASNISPPPPSSVNPALLQMRK